MVMTTSEVPAAYCIGRARASSSAGTTRNPPPTPRNPVSSADDGGGDEHLERPRAGAGEGRVEGDDRVVECRARGVGAAGAAVVAAGVGPSAPPTTSIRTANAASSTSSATRLRGAGAEHGARRRHQPEGHPATEQDVAGAVRGHGTDQRGHPDHDQRAGGGLGGGLVEQVDQHRYGEDRAAAAERARGTGRSGCRRRRRGPATSQPLTSRPAAAPTRGRPAAPALSNESSTATGVRPAAASREAATEAR